MQTHALGSFLLYASIVVGVFVIAASFFGFRRRDGRLMLAAERAGYAVTAMQIAASCLLVNAFLHHDFANKYVQRYSDQTMPWYYLISAFWGGQNGSLMLWSVTLAGCTALVIWQNRQQNRDLLPTVLIVLMATQLFFLVLMVLEANPFDTFRINMAPATGRGLEPLLQNPAMTFHPPSILTGYVWFTVPFAFAVAALVHKRLDDGWIRTTRRYALISWAFLSVGNLFGGMWAYEELGWGGFWGWDPVENASLMPWITATAYLHSVMIQERRGMLKVWNMALVMLTFFLTIFGTFLTRSGLIDSVHTFAQSDVGDYFLWFMIVLAIGSVGLILWRVIDGSLKSQARINSIFSREGVFLLNNLVLIGCVAVVMFGTMGEKISAYLWQETRYTATWFNSFMVPGGLALLLLMGIGPLVPWRRTTWKAFRRNFIVPLIVSVTATVVVWAFDVYHLKTLVAGTHIPTNTAAGRMILDADFDGIFGLIGFFGTFFLIYTILGEFVRGARLRQKNSKEGFFTALFKLSSKNKRRYGGYLTHLGFAGLFLGFIGTGLKTSKDLPFNAVGVTQQIEDKLLTFKGMEMADTREYQEYFAVFDVHQVAEDGSKGALVGVLRPSRRTYGNPNVRMSKNTTEKDELFLWSGNVYLSLVTFRVGTDKVGASAEVMAHFNPLIIYMWLGGAVLIFGVVLAVWPEKKRYGVMNAARKGRAKKKSSEADAETAQSTERSTTDQATG